MLEVMTTLDSRYQKIVERFDQQQDFSEQDLAQSRALFSFSGETVTPRRFDVWTFVAGLPLPGSVSTSFKVLANRVERVLQGKVRMYLVPPERYHWEVFI